MLAVIPLLVVIPMLVVIPLLVVIPEGQCTEDTSASVCQFTRAAEYPDPQESMQIQTLLGKWYGKERKERKGKEKKGKEKKRKEKKRKEKKRKDKKRKEKKRC